jgi:hypothetical protein
LSQGAKIETATCRNIGVKNEAEKARRLSELGEIDMTLHESEENNVESENIEEGELPLSF